MIKFALALCALLLSASATLAHPGHGEPSSSTWAHHLTEPLHLAGWLALGLVSAGCVLHARRRRIGLDVEP